jgi:hypothetical protein
VKKVFLGGTCNGSEWRTKMEKLLDGIGVDYFNPIVSKWDKEAQANELRERETCNYCLYVITPRMIGLYSIAEAVDDSNKRPDKTIFVVLSEDDTIKGLEPISFGPRMQRSLDAVKNMVTRNGALVFDSLEEAARYIDDGIPF